jgi:hypothetical protein
MEQRQKVPYSDMPIQGTRVLGGKRKEKKRKAEETSNHAMCPT